MTRPPIILASASAIRAKILAGAGVAFEARRPDVDETAIINADRAGRRPLGETALRLAHAKASSLAAPAGALVIGADQILDLGGEALEKPASIDEARRRLIEMQGRAHHLVNALVVLRDGAARLRHVETVRIHLRPMSPSAIDRYLGAAGDVVLTSAAAYQAEALGARLIERIDGDYFAVLGLALFPLLACLRAESALDF